jgi:hypothetical protein
MSVQFRATGERLDSVLAKLERGEGTMGKLATDTLLYHRFTDLSASCFSPSGCERLSVPPTPAGSASLAVVPATERPTPADRTRTSAPVRSARNLFLMFLPLWMVTLCAAYGAARRDPIDARRRNAIENRDFPQSSGPTTKGRRRADVRETRGDRFVEVDGPVAWSYRTSQSRHVTVQSPSCWCRVVPHLNRYSVPLKGR